MLFEMIKRASKPRKRGLTALIDRGLSTNLFADIVNSHAEYIDYVKFGWGTAVITPKLNEKIKVLHEKNIDFWFGGTLFEICYTKGALDNYKSWIKDWGVRFIEISDGTVDIPTHEKLALIEKYAKDFTVLSEVGSKDSTKVMSPSHWINHIKSQLNAGAWKIIAEGRESGTAGIYRNTGEVRLGLIQDLLESGINMNDLIFEAPQMAQQTWFIKEVGSDVNLGNINFHDIINLETLRLGLRSDTMNMDK